MDWSLPISRGPPCRALADMSALRSCSGRSIDSITQHVWPGTQVWEQTQHSKQSIGYSRVHM